ncbi:unnamed protein product [Thelazia callipaeda]|uniref:dolichyl-phosphate-mannose--protein mannosyltransferase n=1 Tax=Thelazia callipaeda TaxID=103827 RepID=A0A0N5CKM9_THECL|nr:unnamed protein product [Thelazia callipaeda]
MNQFDCTSNWPDVLGFLNEKRFNYLLSGFDTTSYHIVNILLHATVCIVLNKVFLNLLTIFHAQFPNKIAFRASFFFAIHPIHSEAVASIVGRAELLMALFTLLAFYLYTKSWLKSHFSVLSKTIILLSSIAALFSKEQGIAILPICAIFELFATKITPYSLLTLRGKKLLQNTNKNFINQNAKTLSVHNSIEMKFYYDCVHRIAVCIFICVILLVIRFSINGFQTPQFSSNDNFIANNPSFFFRVMNRCYIYGLYIWLLLYPAQLCFDYSMGCITSIQSIADPRFIISAICFLGLIIYIIDLLVNRYSMDEYRLELFSVIFYMLTFLPASDIFVTVGFVLAERVLYLPSAAFCLTIVILYERIESLLLAKKVKNIIKSSIKVIAVLLFARSYQRSLDWKNELDLYSSGLTVCPNNAKIHYNIAKIMADNGDTDRATLNYANAIKLNPTYEHAMNNLANIHLKQGRASEAEQLLSRALKIKPKFPTAWMNLGLAHLAQKRYQDAQKSFEKALSLRFPYPDCLYNMGILYFEQNHKLYAKQLVNPSHKQAWLNLLLLLDETNNCIEVINLTNKVLNYHSQEASIISQLGICYGKLEKYSKAEKFLLLAVELQPTNIVYWKNIGILYQRWGKPEKAKFAYWKAFQLQMLFRSIK